MNVEHNDFVANKERCANIGIDNGLVSTKFGGKIGPIQNSNYKLTCDTITKAKIKDCWNRYDLVFRDKSSNREFSTIFLKAWKADQISFMSVNRARYRRNIG